MEIWLTALGSSVATISLAAGLCYLLRTWIASRIQYSIRHEYDKDLALISHERNVATKAELVADLMAEWISDDVDYQRLNELSFKSFLWLPPEIAIDLSASLSHKKDAPDLRALIARVRNHLLGESEAIDPMKVIVFRKREHDA